MISRRSILQSGLALAASSLVMSRARAATALSGNVTQGALIRGRVESGTKVSFDGKLLNLSANGDFAFGFAYDRKDPAVLRIELPEGEPIEQTLKPSVREYRVQIINGLPEKFVEPPASVLDRINRDNALIGAARSRDTDEDWFADDFAWPVKGPLDVIFCRNVMIYFDMPTQYQILSRFDPLMEPDGLMFAGRT